MANRNIIMNPVTDFWPQLLEPFRHMGARLSEPSAPAAEVSSDDDAYRVTLELPGMGEEDVELNVEAGIMTIKGEKKTEREDSGEHWLFSERRYGSFSRSFRLPEDADADAVSAQMKDGLLTVTFPRTAPRKPEARRVPIARG